MSHTLRFLPTDKRELIEAYGSICQVQGCQNPATELHHAVFKRDKRKKFKKWNEGMWWNLQPVCHECNVITHKADRYDNRMYWLRNQWRYYRKEILNSLEVAPEKIILYSEEYKDAMEEVTKLCVGGQR